ncbi:DNRLRE domain-containing protein [Nocardiopsis sp. NPDC007018]|uniref:DNRLRE domain-containing protein n=1 Tax=Nocardiopsis sp. NPDC007018 TaxID=3155721 RepID=UPI003405EFD2
MSAEVASSRSAFVDRAFPDLPSRVSETGSVGTGRLAWEDRVYTRRALFRFPVAHDSGTAVESAVLRVEVAWSYDCANDSLVELRRVGPFDENATWNDQPTAHELLDTRNVRGGHPSCPVEGGVEFDVTEAYQRALDAGEDHLHLRMGERDESGTTAWRRFDVADAPPVLVVDHAPARDANPSAEDTRATTATAGPGPRLDPAPGTYRHDSTADPLPPVELPAVPPTRRIDHVALTDPTGIHRVDEERTPGSRTHHTAVPVGERSADDTADRARGPPSPRHTTTDPGCDSLGTGCPWTSPHTDT